jgi:glycosyltransferase involved in cell wall biosynthesis
LRRIAFFSPLTPMRTGVADYSEALLPYLARALTLDLYVAGYAPASDVIRRQFEVLDYHSFESLRRKRRYDAVVYQMGASPFHGYVYESLLRRPGITVLHDLVLHHFFIARTLGERDTSGYVREMAYNVPESGANLARAAIAGHEPYPYFQIPLYHRVLDSSLSVIVHNEHMASRVRADYPNALVTRVPLLCDPQATVKSPALTEELRRRWQIPAGAFVVASFGRITPPKRLDVLLRALLGLRTEFPSAFCLLVGEMIAPFDLGDLFQQFGLSDAMVRLTGHVPQAEYYAAFDLADVAVNLRYPSAGETSAAVIQLLGHGVPLIVSDVDAFSELPDSVAIKVPVTPREVDSLVVALSALARQKGLRLQMGRAARAYAAGTHDPERAAETYIRHIEATLMRRAGHE